MHKIKQCSVHWHKLSLNILFLLVLPNHKKIKHCHNKEYDHLHDFLHWSWQWSTADWKLLSFLTNMSEVCQVNYINSFEV